MQQIVDKVVSFGGLLRPDWGRECPPTIGKLTLALAATSLVAGGDVEADVGMSITLALVAGVMYIAFGLVMANSVLFERSGHIILDRVLNTEANWEQHTLRSFMEIFSWLYVILHGYNNGK